MKLQDRLTAYLKYKQLNYRDFERICKLGNGTAAALGDKTRNTTFNRISIGCPDLNIDWLRTGEGAMLNKGAVKRETPATGDVMRVPLINLDARGGFEGNEEEGAEYYKEMIPWNGARQGDFAIEVSGFSMMPIIAPGSRVLLRQVEDWRDFIEKNIPYVVELRDGRRLLKVLSKSDKGDGYVVLYSYNMDYPPQELPLKLIQRVYKVVGLLTNYGF